MHLHRQNLWMIALKIKLLECFCARQIVFDPCLTSVERRTRLATKLRRNRCRVRSAAGMRTSASGADKGTASKKSVMEIRSTVLAYLTRGARAWVISLKRLRGSVVGLLTSFEYQVERSLGRSSELRETCLLEHVPEARLTCLCSQTETHLLRQ